MPAFFARRILAPCPRRRPWRGQISLKMALHNRVSRRELKERIIQDPTPRTTISFYCYFRIEDPAVFRNELYRDFAALGVMGRIYVAQEGINAQISVPASQFEAFRQRQAICWCRLAISCVSAGTNS